MEHEIKQNIEHEQGLVEKSPEERRYEEQQGIDELIVITKQNNQGVLIDPSPN